MEKKTNILVRIKQWVLSIVRQRKSKRICKNCKRYNRKTKKCFAPMHFDICGIRLNPKTDACFEFENRYGNNYVA